MSSKVLLRHLRPMLRHGLYLIHSKQHSQYPKTYKNEKLGKKLERNTEDLTVQ